ncbi:MAG: hypothetical protein R3B13_08595 [Polyangiaceae bacterium]
MRAAVCVVLWLTACSARTGGDQAPATQEAGADSGAADASTGDGGLDATTDGASESGIDCSLVGCGAPPLCATGCTEPCGCCPCADGTVQSDLVCQGGCWTPLDPGG